MIRFSILSGVALTADMLRAASVAMSDVSDRLSTFVRNHH